LWVHRPFLLLWTGQSISQLGSQVTLVALPLTAILVLSVSPFQVGLLTAAGFGPAALVGPLAGAYVDRVRRRPLQIGCQLILGATTFSVPLAAWFGLLRLEHLFALQAINGALNIASTAAGQAYLPSVVERSHLSEANGKLASSGAFTRVVGPGFGGVLVQLATAPVAMVVDAISFVISAVCLLLIDAPEPAARSTGKRSIASDIHEGLYLVLGHRLIRPLMLAVAGYNFFAAIFVAVYTLFMVRELGLAPASIGAIVACGGVGGVVGGLLAEPVARRFGIGRAIVGGMILLATMHLAAPAAFGPPLVSVPVLATGGMLAQLALAVSAVNRTSMIQQIVPAHAQGRVSATQQVIVLASVPIGAALGGVMGATLGLRGTVVIAALGSIVATGALVRSPLWTTSSVALMEEVAEVPSRPGREPPTRLPSTVWQLSTTQ